MTYFHYYATTSRNLDRVFQYGVFPLSQAVGSIVANKYFGLTGDARFEASANIARWLSAGAYSALTSTFFALESELINDNTRDAVSAELGMDPSEFKFSDLRRSSNAIASKAYTDILRMQKYRYGSDAMFLLPIAMKGISEASGVSWERSKKVRDNPDNYSYAQHIFNGHNAWDYGIYAGKAAYWGGETFFVPKSGHYEVVKLLENLQSTGKDIVANDLLGVYQRTRTDRGGDIIESDDKASLDALRPIMQKMASEYNKHDGKLGIPEIVYLIGLGKVNLHARDGKTLDPQAIAASYAEIDKVVSIGLKGIREENRALRKSQPNTHARSLTDRVADVAFATAQTVLGAVRGKSGRKRPEEYITARDPGELTSYNYSINR